MDGIEQFFADLSGILWGPWLLVLLVGTGIWLTILLKGIQFRLLPYALRLTFSRERAGQGDVSHFGALMISLAATIGSGNIAGVATAVTLGGPGAVVWMWISRLVRHGHQIRRRISRRALPAGQPQGRDFRRSHVLFRDRVRVEMAWDLFRCLWRVGGLRHWQHGSGQYHLRPGRKFFPLARKWIGIAWRS